MSSTLQSSNRDECTDAHELAINLLELIGAGDARLGYYASACLERLTALRAEANALFVRWNLLNTAPLEKSRELAEIYRALMDRLERLTDVLQTSRTWRRLDPKIVEAGVRVQEAWRTLKERDAA